MYSLVELPQLPTDARLTVASHQQSFIDESEIHSMLRHQRQNWLEQRYLGEDFAGRDDCLLSSDDAHSVPRRQQIGAFFTPISVAPQSAPAKITFTPMAPSSARPWVVAVASSLLLAAGLAGFWMARPHEPAPPTAQQTEKGVLPPDSIAKSETVLIVIDKRH